MRGDGRVFTVVLWWAAVFFTHMKWIFSPIWSNECTLLVPMCTYVRTSRKIVEPHSRQNQYVVYDTMTPRRATRKTNWKRNLFKTSKWVYTILYTPRERERKNMRKVGITKIFLFFLSFQVDLPRQYNIIQTADYHNRGDEFSWCGNKCEKKK